MPHPFWHAKRVLVTGHTGFKGAWLSLWLRRLGAAVTGYALDPPTRPSLFDLARVADDCRSVHGDVRDLDHLARVVREGRFEVVFHLAAQALVRAGYRDPVDTYATNVLGTVHVLEAVRQAGGVRAVVVVTSDKCYENTNRAEGHGEAEPMGGRDPYSSSKGCAELVTSAYRRSFFSDASGAAVATARAGNAIGGGDWGEDRLVADCMRALAAGETIRVRRPDAVRPWQFVLEPLDGYLLLAQRLCEERQAVAEAWNFGPDAGDAGPVRQVVERIVDLWGAGARWEVDPGKHPPEAAHLALDCSKARTRLGWAPRTDLERALAWTVEWHQGLAARRDPREMTLEQIDAFMER